MVLVISASVLMATRGGATAGATVDFPPLPIKAKVKLSPFPPTPNLHVFRLHLLHCSWGPDADPDQDLEAEEEA
jgi:hypothetical protein